MNDTPFTSVACLPGRAISARFSRSLEHTPAFRRSCAAVQRLLRSVECRTMVLSKCMASDVLRFALRRRPEMTLLSASCRVHLAAVIELPREQSPVHVHCQHHILFSKSLLLRQCHYSPAHNHFSHGFDRTDLHWRFRTWPCCWLKEGKGSFGTRHVKPAYSIFPHTTAMELNRPSDPNSWSARLVSGIAKKFRSDKQYTEAAVAEKRKKEGAKLRKKNLKSQPSAPQLNELGERSEYAIFGDQRPTTSRKEKDHGDMLHRLAHHDSFDSLLDKPHMLEELRDPYFSSDKYRKRNFTVYISEKDERRISSLPDELWKRIASFLNPIDAANLALSKKALYRKLAMVPFRVLDEPENRNLKIAFLRSFDRQMPDHLLCFVCAKYHRRLQPGKEVLKMIEYVRYPVFNCPRVRETVLPRMRLTYGRVLPYSFVQLALRHATLGPQYGVDHSTLARKWKDKDTGWTHRTRYMIHDGKLLMRIVSQVHTPPSSVLTETAERHILYDREEHTPFFSICAHWRDGDLMKICKCMMSHVPAPPDPYHKQIQRSFKLNRAAANPDFIVRGCDECRPARRCPECPTEYLVEVQMVEDTADKVNPFKHALVVTRWSDLGDGSNPYTSPEWTAINGTTNASEQGYSSFTNIGRRAIGGIFESNISGEIPGQRLISLNPSNKKLGEEGHGWY